MLRLDLSKKRLGEGMEKKYEEHAYVLDYLPHGRPQTQRGGRTEATVILLGDQNFTLLEAKVKPGFAPKPQDRVYVGKESREEITHIAGRIGYEDLTAAAREELETAIRSIILSDEKRYVGFFNTAQAVTTRMSELRILKGIGKKYMMQILRERERKPFDSFDDLQKRTQIPSPILLITKRIIVELSNADVKYRKFARR
jgi:putative nucleotide binding protein